MKTQVLLPKIFDFPFTYNSKIKTKIGGGHAGHNGLRSIQKHLGPDYFRVRLGVGHPGDKAKVSSYVLSNFPKNNEADLSVLLGAVAEGFPQLQEGNQEKFLNIVSGQSNIAKKISDETIDLKHKVKIFIQVNIGKENQKSGINVENLENFYQFCLSIGLNVVGIMCIPPIDKNPEKYFGEMKILKDKLKLKELSMGMSDDYLEAIKYSATYVRIGSSIFGKRN